MRVRPKVTGVLPANKSRKTPSDAHFLKRRTPPPPTHTHGCTHLGFDESSSRGARGLCSFFTIFQKDRLTLWKGKTTDIEPSVFRKY
jgi:hypothetical protein